MKLYIDLSTGQCFPTKAEAVHSAKAWNRLTGDAVEVVEWNIGDTTTPEQVCAILNRAENAFAGCPVVESIPVHA